LLLLGNNLRLSLRLSSVIPTYHHADTTSSQQLIMNISNIRQTNHTVVNYGNTTYIHLNKTYKKCYTVPGSD